MGELVAAAVVAHQPMIMIPERYRVELGGTGKDTTLIEPGFRRLREAFRALSVDTFVIVDTHWFTTTEHVLAGADHFKGLFTSDEMPRNICDLPYDFPGAPELAKAWHAVGKDRKLFTVNVTTASLPRHYPTINLVHHLRTTEKVLSCGVVQTGRVEDHLALGAALGEAIERVEGRVAILGSGGMSHTFWPLDVIRDHFGYAKDHVISPDACAADERILGWWKHGDHASVLGYASEYRRQFKPEGGFAHYLIAVGAMGGDACTVPGEQMSDYENAVGTGQVHVLFRPGA